MYNLLTSILLFRKLRNNLSLPKADLEAIQVGKLKALISHAYENVPYYRKLFASAGIKPADIKGVEDLAKIPTTSKLKLQSLKSEEILARNVDLDRCISDVTSGSTGIPLRVYFTPEDYMHRSLIFIRTFMETGYRLTHRQAIVCDTRFLSNKEYWFQRLGIFRKKYVPVQLDMEKQLAILKSFKPNYIHGYPLSLAEIAYEMLNKGIKDITPRMVCTGAELVSKKTREIINKVFKVDMVDTYATIESGLIAWECFARKGYHLNIDSTVMEVLKDDRAALPGESGRVVITNLHSFAMPIIRYELRDVCILSEDTCTCGIALPLMRIIEGRTDDMIRTPQGRIISPNSITNVMEAVNGVRQFKIVQEQENTLLVQIVKARDFSDDAPETARKLLRELIGEDMEIMIQFVSSIPKDKTGKLRAVISNCNPQKTI
jgi:phenylacetate-CoA ligase